MKRCREREVSDENGSTLRACEQPIGCGFLGGRPLEAAVWEARTL